MKTLKFSILLIFLLAFGKAFGQSFTEAFDTDPCGASCTSFSRTYSGVQFNYTFGAQGDGGKFFYSADYGVPTNPSSMQVVSETFNVATTEQFVINRNDGLGFIFNSIFIDNNNGETVTVQGYLNGNPVGTAQTVSMGVKSTLAFGGITVDEVRFTSNDFFGTNFDSFSGEIPSSTPDISINNVSLSENNTTASFTISLSAASSSTITVDYGTANGTATANSDYTPTTGTLTFNPGQTSKTINVTILEDLLYENNETFFVNLTNPVNANIADSQGQCTINNDDVAPSVTLTTPAISKTESEGSFSVVANLSAASGLTTTVNLSYGGAATSGTDYTPVTSIVIPAGDLNNSGTINITNDLIDETDETIVVDISSVVNGSESGTQQLTLTITDDDEKPIITSSQSFSVNENSVTSTVVGTVAATDGNAGTTFQNWTITTNANPDGDGNNAFSINSNTGQVTVNDPGDLNYESNTSLIIQVAVSDGTNTSSLENVTININDLDDNAPSMSTNTGITLNEDATETINSTELQANDTDTDNDNLNYAITSVLANGQLELTTGPGIGISSFDQAQINANQVVYVHDGSNTTSDSFTFDVQDGSGNNLIDQAFNIKINAVDDDAPMLSVNTALSLDEGATKTISSGELQYNDADTDNDNLNYAITSAPANGQLELTTGPGTAVSSFTQAQINANQVIYVHDGSNTTTDSFEFDVQDGSSNNLIEQIFNITVKPVDDEIPTINSLSISSSNGEPELVKGGELLTVTFGADEELNISSLSLTNIKSGGTTVNNVASVNYAATANTNEYTAQFTIDNTDADGTISFALNYSDVAGNAGIQLSESDITDASVVVVDNTAPSISSIVAADANPNYTTSVNYTVSFSEKVSNVEVSDFSISKSLEIIGGSVSSVTPISESQYTVTVSGFDLNENYTSGSLRLNFISDGSVLDKVGLTTLANYLGATVYTILHPNPTITTNTGIILAENASETIDSGELQADDPDTNNDDLVFVITTAPANGHLALTTTPEVAGSSFTQAQLNANQLIYVHDGSNTTSDSFTFEVQDGNGNNLPGQTFSITINAVDDDPPTITANTGITLNEGATETINSGELQADDTDTDNNTLTYAITTPPANGKLELTTAPGTAISNFTQKQINDNQVVYINDGSNTTSDSFTFDLQDGSGNKLTGQTFSITVNSVDDDTPTITANTGTTLEEGATKTISSGELQANDTDTNNETLTFAITSAPVNGNLELTTNSGIAISSFTQAALNANQVICLHDGSNTITDSFAFTVQDGSGNNLSGQTFSITVIPIDDETPSITANTGITLDEGATETIGSDDLQADDADTNNDNLTFAITSAPANGQVELITSPGITVNSFTQAQINANQVVYIHDDGNTTSDSFTFDVQDGSGNNLPGLTFSITINSIDDDAPTITANTAITVEEGATQTISSHELQANDSDTDNDNIIYSITAAPANGQLELSTNVGIAITSFTQAQLNAGEVVYTHDHSNNTSDGFDFSLSDGSGNYLTGQTFGINLTPVDDDAPQGLADSFETGEDQVLEVPVPGVLENDSDTEATTLTAVLESETSNGTISFNADGSFTYTPDADFNGTDSFSYRSSDGSNSSAVTTVAISITPVNDPPVISQLSGFQMEVNTTSQPISFEIHDVDNALDELSLTATSANTSLLPDANIVLSGTGSSRTFSMQPAAGEIGSTLLTLSVSDGQSQSFTSFDLSVIVMNSTPTDIRLSNTQFLETLASGQSIGSFTTEDEDTEDTYTYTFVSGTGDAENSHFTIQDDQLLVNASFDYDARKQFSIRIRSTDDRGAHVEQVFILSLLPDADLDPVIYNGFTPNGDGVNDTWEIDNIAVYPNMVVRVYNRNGQELFKSEGYRKPWDGRYGGQELPLGTYYYLIDLNNGSGKIYKGTVMVLK